MKRIFDLIVALTASLLLLPLFIGIALAIKLTSKGPVLYWSNRIGKNNLIFRMPKFRTMNINTPTLGKRHLNQPEQYLTPVGPFLRKTSLDEIPQLWSIIKGNMSLVGPRPILTNEMDLLVLRTREGIHLHTPGLTGWAQINGRDSVAIEQRVELDKKYIKRKSFLFDIYIILKTIPNVLFKKNVQY